MSVSKLTAIKASKDGSDVGAFVALDVPGMFVVTVSGGQLQIARSKECLFGAGLDGWAAFNGGYVLQSGGGMRVGNSAAYQGGYWATLDGITLVDGEWYELLFKTTTVNGAWFVQDHWGTVAGGTTEHTAPVIAGWNSFVFRYKQAGRPVFYNTNAAGGYIDLSVCRIRAGQGDGTKVSYVQLGYKSTAVVSAVAIGNSAIAPSEYQVAVGHNANTSLVTTWDATATAGDCVSVGPFSKAAAWRAVAIGPYCVAGAVSSTAVGANSFCGQRHAVALGRGSYIPGAELTVPGDQPSLVLGGSLGSHDTHVYFGSGWANYFDTPPSGVSIGNLPDLTAFETVLHGWDAWDSRAAATEADDPGGNLVLAGGAGTGSANGGDVRMDITIAGVAGNTKNPRLGVFAASPSAAKSTFLKAYNKDLVGWSDIGSAIFYDGWDDSAFNGLLSAGDDTFQKVFDKFDQFQLSDLSAKVGEGLNNAAAVTILEVSTFSGWMTAIGVQPTFNAVKIRVRTHNGGAPTSVVVRVKEGGYSGTLLASGSADWADRDENDYLTIALDTPVNSSQGLWLSYQGNDKLGLYGAAIGSGTESRYWTAGSQADNGGAHSSTDYVMWVELFNSFDLGDIDDRLNALESAADSPRLLLPDTLYAVTNDELQLFHRSIVETIDVNRYHINIQGADLGDGTGGITEAKCWPRYVEIKPATDGTRSLTYDVVDSQNNIVSTKTVSVECVTASGLVPASVRVLCVGDSLTASGIWPAEFDRRLTGTGGSPSGLNYSGISFIGSQGSGTLHEGRSGWSWATFTGASSPFDNGGELDITNYIENTLGETTVDHVYFLMTWNNWSATLRANAADWAAEVALAKQLIDAFVDAYPGVQITLAAPTLPDILGGVAANYGDGNGAYGDHWKMRQGILGMHLAYQTIADDPAYSSFVDVVAVACQHDIEYNMIRSTRDVNSRNSTVQESYGTNGVHPSTEGQYQIADAMFRHFIYKYCS